MHYGKKLWTRRCPGIQWGICTLVIILFFRNIN